MKKTKLILSSSILSTIALAPLALGSCATVSKVVNKNSSIINSVTYGSFIYDVDTENKTATLIAPDTTVSEPSFNTIPATIEYSSDTYSVTAIADNAFDSFTKFEKGTVSIGSNVKTIGKYAFYRCKNITGVTFNSVLTNIGDYAFKKCTNFKGNCTIPATIKTIGVGAFEDTAIEYVNPTGTFDNLVSIGACAFKNCTELTTIGTFKKIESIGASAFYGCAKLTGTSTSALTIPTTCNSIGALAFKGCIGLSGKCIAFADEVYWSRNGSSEDTQPMEPSKSDPKVNYENLVDEDGLYWKSNLTKYIPVESITVGVKNFPVSGVYTEGDEDGVNVTVEPENATCKTFYYTDNSGGNIKLENYTGNFVCQVAGNFAITAAAQDGSGVTGTSISYAIGVCPVQSINWKSTPPTRTFNGATVDLAATATLDESVTDPEAQEQYSQINYSIIEGSDKADIDENGLLTTKAWGTVKVKATSAWYSGKFAICTIEIGSTLNIEDGVCNGFFEDAVTQQGSLTTSGPIYTEFGNVLTIPSTVTSIADYAFYNKDTSRNTIPQCISRLDLSSATSLESIGDYAFFTYNGVDFSSASGISFPASIKTVGSYAFGNRKNITSLDLSSCTKLQTLEEFCFNAIVDCVTISLPSNSNLTVIPRGCCQSTPITTFTVPKTIATITYQAFMSCEELTKITFEDDAARWTDGTNKYSVLDPTANAELLAQASWPGLTKGSVSDVTCSGVGTIKATSGTTYTGHLELPGSAYLYSTKYTVTDIAVGGFEGQKGITSVYLPEKLTTIGTSAFYNCTSLKEINFPASLTSLGSTTPSSSASTFASCTALETIDLEDTNISVIPGYSFENCTGATSVKLPKNITQIGWSAFENLGQDGAGVTLEIPTAPSSGTFNSGSFYNANILTIYAGENASIVWNWSVDLGGSSGTKGIFENCKNLYIPKSVTTLPEDSYAAKLGFTYVGEVGDYSYFSRS